MAGKSRAFGAQLFSGLERGPARAGPLLLVHSRSNQPMTRPQMFWSRPPAFGVVSAPHDGGVPEQARGLEDLEAVRAVAVRVPRVGSRDGVPTVGPGHEHLRPDGGDVVVVPEERDVAVAELLPVQLVRDRRRERRRPARSAVRRGRVERLHSGRARDGSGRVRGVLVLERNRAPMAVRARCGVDAGVLPDDVQLAAVRVDVRIELVPLRLRVDPRQRRPRLPAVLSLREVDRALAGSARDDRPVRGAGRPLAFRERWPRRRRRARRLRPAPDPLRFAAPS